MKRKIQVVIIAVSLLFLGIFLNYESISAWIGNVIITVPVKSLVEIHELLEGDRQISCDSSVLRYDDSLISYDANTNTIYIPQTMEETYWKGKLEPVKKDGQLFFCEDSAFMTKAEAIKTGHVFKLYYIGNNEYCVFDVVFTGMPLMNIQTRDYYEEDERIIWQGSVQVYDQYRTSLKLQQAECTYRIRGGTSEDYEKPGYKLELTDKKLSLLGMDTSRDWILNALYDDAGLIHNKLSYEVWHEIASYNQVPNDDGILMEYVEVFIDDEYLGVYALLERADRKTLDMRESDILYKCRAMRIPEEHNYTNEDTDGLHPIFILKYPKNHTAQDWEPLKRWVNYFCKEQFSGYEDGGALLNMENAIDYNLFILLSCATDNTRKNSFLIAEYQANGEYQFKKVPWDLNGTWGNPWIDVEECNYTMYDSTYITDVDTWYTDISTLYYYNETEVARLLMTRWKELRDEQVITKEKINDMIDAELSYLHNSGAYERNYKRWPHGSEYWQDGYIYEYVDGRIDFLDKYFEQLYADTISEAIYEGIDYADEFDVRYYWTKNYEVLSELYPYNREILLEHYVWYGRPYGMIAKKPDSNNEVQE